jgi:glycosyltransferase involved in cell wall biosynthesis
VSDQPALVHVNLSHAIGGAEIYTTFFIRALAGQGWRNRLVTRVGAGYWNGLDAGATERIAIADDAELAGVLKPGDLVIVHAPVREDALAATARCAFVCGVAHAAIDNGVYPAYYDAAGLMLGVSRFVLDGLLAHGIRRLHPDPLLGFADLSRQRADAVVRSGPPCEWDRRKFRDRVFKLAAAAVAPWRRPRTYTRRPGVSLGIVSRLAAQKQFPALFDAIAPAIAAQPGVHLEIFGAAIGYKELRELRRALRPIALRTRFWGYQTNVAAVYPTFDYLLPGLPEREALGLNLIESCTLGTPVLAVRAPPFTEILHEGATGFFYADPRQDHGADFARVLAGLVEGRLRIDRTAMAPHLAEFSFDRFVLRADAAMRAAAAAAGQTG